MSGTLVRRLQHHPRGVLTAPITTDEASTRLTRTGLPLRPGRFIVNNPVTRTPDWSIPREFVSSEPDVVGPLQTAMYVGRVEDVLEGGKCSVRVWEVPNGRVGMIALTRERLGDAEVEVGDTLRVYAWIEVALNDEGVVVERSRVRAVATPRTKLTNEQRQRLSKLLEALASERG